MELPILVEPIKKPEEAVDLTALRILADKITSNPIYPAYLEAVEEYRSERNAVPDTDD